MIRIRLLAVLILGAGVAASALAAQAPFAKVVAGENWKGGDRLQAEQVDGRAAMRMTGGNVYIPLRVTGSVPKDGQVMLRIAYRSTGGPISGALGGWGAPSLLGLARPAGWQTEELVFAAGAIRRGLKNDEILVTLHSDGKPLPSIQSIELFVPTREEIMTAFRKWVRQATDDAFAASKTAEFTIVKGETVPAPALSDAEKKAPCIPFARSYLNFIFPETVPTAEERTTKGQVNLTPGEYESFQFALYANKDFPALSVEALNVPKGLNVDVRWEECVPVRNGGSRSTKFRIQPNRLWPAEIFPTCDAKAGTSRAWYAIVKADDNVEARTYPVKLAVKDAGRTVAEFELTVNVLPFKLPRQAQQAIMLTDSTSVEDETVIAALADYGVNALGAFDGYRPTADGKVDFTEWDAYIAALKRHGIDRAFFWWLGNPNSGNSVKASVGQAKFTEIIKGLDARVVDGRYPKWVVLSVDEAIASGKALAESKQLYTELKKDAPDLKLLQCAMSSSGATAKYDGFLDMISCNGSFDAISKWCQEHKILLNIYGSVSAGITANSNRSLYGFHAYRYGANAVNGWAMRWYNGHPYNDLDARLTDWSIFLPNWLGGVISAPSWEGFREGVDDLRYLAVLEDLVKRGKSDGKLLAELRENGVGKMSESRETVRGDSTFGVSMQNAQDLDLARARVIQEILKAMKK